MGKLTDAAIRDRKATGRNDQWLSDGSQNTGRGCLVVRISPAGGRTFYYRYTDTTDAKRKRVHIAIGPYSQKGDGKATFTLGQARDKCADLIEAHRKHGDVRGHIRAEQRRAVERRRQEVEAAAAAAREAASGSFGALLDAYERGLERTGKRSAAAVRCALKLHVRDPWPGLCERKASEIKPADIRAILARMVDAGILRQTDKMRAYLRAAFGTAIKARHNPAATAVDFCIELNPAAPIARIDGANKRGERRLDASELQAFWLELEAESPVLRDAVRLAIALGGQRFAQLCRVTPVDIDIQTATIRLFDPKGMRKEPREHLLPLNRMADCRACETALMRSRIAVSPRAQA